MTDPAATLAAQLTAGEAALAAGRHADAARLLQPVADALPTHLGIARMVAGAWQLAGARHRGRAVLVRAVDAMDTTAPGPGDDEAYALGAQLLDLGAPHAALRMFSAVQRRRPDNAALLGALAAAHRALGNLDDAWAFAQRAVARDKRNPALLLTAAQVRHAQGALDDALAWLKKAEALRPGHAPTRLQRALTRLLQRPTRHGWADFEQRGLPTLPAGTVAWRGDALGGRTIVVVCDQGLGDLFHFVRFTPLLAERGAARVIVAAPASTVSLLRASGVDAVTASDVATALTGAAEEVLAVPLLSLPHHLGIEDAAYGERVPYLRTGASPADALPADALPADALPAGAMRSAGAPRRLGLVLTGNPDYLTTLLRDTDDTVPPALAAMPGVEWVWLQPGLAPPAALAHIAQPPLSGDWLDTARLVKALDGVVSVDTAMAHLTGALGRPLHVLLPFTPDWRWGWQGVTTPWYPTATLHRQARSADWSEAMASLARTLARPDSSI
ncbi:MAG: hypothetical protein LCH84_06730 [Gemmatimonadetes bacterium]|nr:hypothetical protein [Gemmatimonadota bacterium]